MQKYTTTTTEQQQKQHHQPTKEDKTDRRADWPADRNESNSGSSTVWLGCVRPGLIWSMNWDLSVLLNRVKVYENKKQDAKTVKVWSHSEKIKKKMLGNSETVCWLHCGVILTPSHELVLLLRQIHKRIEYFTPILWWEQKRGMRRISLDFQCQDVLIKVSTQTGELQHIHWACAE